jgi:hypothetical protein
MSYGAHTLLECVRLRDRSCGVVDRDYWAHECLIWASLLIGGVSA